MASAYFPSRTFRRSQERVSGLLFAFGVDDLSTDLPTGQTLTFDRNSPKTVLDCAGRVTTLANDQVPWGGWYNSAEAQWEPVLVADNATTNLCLQSENFGTTWAAIGTPTRTAAAATCGDLSLDLIGDDAAGTLEAYSQTVSFTGNGVKAFSLFLKAGTSTSTVVRMRDTTAGANRLLQVITWSGGVPSVTPTTGTHIATIACFGGAYRFLFQTNSVTAANTNQVEIYPATTGALAVANTGTVYVGGVQCENKEYPSSYVRTTTATVTTVADVASAPANWQPQDFTAYLRIARPAWAGLAGSFLANRNLLNRGLLGSTGSFWIYFNASARQLIAEIEGNTASRTVAASVPATEFIDICAQYEGVVSASSARVRLDVGGGFGGWSSTMNGLTTWSADTLYINANPGGSSVGDAGVRRAIIAPGLRTLEQMRGLAV